jgi:hypothetical protein
MMPAIFTTPNGADVTVQGTKRYADTHGRGYYNFNQLEPKAQTAKVRAGGSTPTAIMPMPRNDDVWILFFPLLDK